MMKINNFIKNNKPKTQNTVPGYYNYKNDLFPQGPR